MIIETPKLRWKSRRSAWKISTAQLHAGSPLVRTSAYEYRVGDILYYPYWIGKVMTVKPRLMFGDKYIFFYVVCNATNGNYLVMRKLPPLREEQADEETLIPRQVSQERFEGEIVEESIPLHIERQFIVGKPQCETMGSKLCHIPVREVSLRKKRSGERFQRYLVNLFNNRVESHVPQTAGEGEGLCI